MNTHRLSIRPEGRFSVIVCSCGSEKITDGPAHEIAHLNVCYAAGLETSPTLLRVVHEDPSFADDDLVAFEEAAVLEFQKFVSKLG